MADKTKPRGSFYIKHPRVQIEFPEKGLAKQSFAEECDINTIMKQFEKSGLTDHVQAHQGSYGDVTGAMDYHAALNMTIHAKEVFLTLPASIREKFDNSPGKFFEFADNPNNQEEMRNLGLLPPTKSETKPAGTPADESEGDGPPAKETPSGGSKNKPEGTSSGE